MTKGDIFKLAWMIARELAAICLSLTGFQVGPKKYFSMSLKAAWKYFKLMKSEDEQFTIIGKFERTESGGLKIFLPSLQEGSPDLKWFEIHFEDYDTVANKLQDEFDEELDKNGPDEQDYINALNPEVLDETDGYTEFKVNLTALNGLYPNPFAVALNSLRDIRGKAVGQMILVFLRYKCGLHFDIPIREVPRLLTTSLVA